MGKYSLPRVLLLAALLLGAVVAPAPAPAATKKKTPSKAPSKKPAPKDVVKKPEAPPAEPPPPLAPGELPLVARSALSLDLKTGKVLYEKNPDAMEYPASATKILTALLVIEAGNLDQLVTVQLEDTKVEPSALEIKPGETYARKQLLYALLLKSANDVAMALGRDQCGSVAAFAEKMNQRAAELGAKDSHFTNPHGLHDVHHFTTAHDLALIARAAMQNPLFREIVATPEAMMQKGDMMVKLRNHNRLLGMMAGCNGVKTGYTVPAQQVLVSSAAREGQEVLSVVLHTNKPGIWEDSKMLLNDGFVKLGVALPAVDPAPSLLTPVPVQPALPVPNGGVTPATPGAPKPPVLVPAVPVPGGGLNPIPPTGLKPAAPAPATVKPSVPEPTSTLIPAK